MVSPSSQRNEKENKLSWVVKDLLRGQEFASKLSNLMQDSSPEAGSLMGEILRTFSQVISALDGDWKLETGNGESLPEQSESGDQRSGISTGKIKTKQGLNQKGNCRKRARPSSSSRTVHAKTMDDGQAWRKYGQKDILNSKSPRSYFRCTHKYEQGCIAIKQVQKSEEDPSIFIITYIGEHTCRDPSTIPHIIETSLDGSRLISFGSNNSTQTSTTTANKLVQENVTSPSFQSLKQEGEEEVISNLTPGNSMQECAKIADRTVSGDLMLIGDVTSSFHCIPPTPSNLDDMGFMDSTFELEELVSFYDL